MTKVNEDGAEVEKSASRALDCKMLEFFDFDEKRINADDRNTSIGGFVVSIIN